MLTIVIIMTIIKISGQRSANKRSKEIFIMKKIICLFLALAMLVVFAACSEEPAKDQGSGTVSGDNASQSAGEEKDDDRIGDYSVVIDSCRLAKDYEDKDVVIVKYIFTNVEDDEPASFDLSIGDTVYQNGVELSSAYVLSDDANYDSDNSLKEIKKGATIEVEKAYELDDPEAEIEVEVTDWLSMSDDKIVKTFTLK